MDTCNSWKNSLTLAPSHHSVSITSNQQNTPSPPRQPTCSAAEASTTPSTRNKSPELPPPLVCLSWARRRRVWQSRLRPVARQRPASMSSVSCRPIFNASLRVRRHWVSWAACHRWASSQWAVWRVPDRARRRVARRWLLKSRELAATFKFEHCYLSSSENNAGNNTCPIEYL